MGNPLPLAFGFVGLGAMGFPMAANLRKKLPSGSKLLIYDVNQAVLHNFLHESTGADVEIASCAKEVVDKTECILTIVPEGSHVKDVYLTPETGLLSSSNLAGKLFIDCSTIDIATSQHISSIISSLPLTPPALFFDAPVSGGTPGAFKGTLTFMLGASPNSPTLPILKSILSLMGSTIHPMGAPALGLAAKLSNNYLSGMIALATAEAMNLGMRLGLEPTALSRCFASSSGASWVNETVNPVPGVCPDAVTSKGYEGGFKVQLMKKDMTLAVEAAKQVDAKLVLADAGLGAYAAASEDPRCRDRDSRVVYRWLGGAEPESS
ncbi:NAD binding domain of 6-phosphogluconate dehydrogenase-domain-containing protein [Cyathus striatus]|nr:NAD binding domain of 6-phosphogluconate dehydrogenase-domain-containing protein [Cyathus striatus]